MLRPTVPTLRMVLIMYLSSWLTKNTLPDLPGLGSSRSAWSPAPGSTLPNEPLVQNSKRQGQSHAMAKRMVSLSDQASCRRMRSGEQAQPRRT